MAEPLFSPSWYRVSSLKPRLRGHTRIVPHHYRGELWYVLQDHVSGRTYRFTPTAYQVIGLMDGVRDVQTLWEMAAERYGDDAPNQGEMVRLLSQLHSADVLLCDVPPDTAELLRRAEKIEGAWWKMNLRSPLSLRFPLFDPEKVLSRTVRFVRPLFSVFGAIVWLAVVGTALVLAGSHWSELTENVVDRILSAENLFTMWLVYPILKATHEFGHGFAVKTWGGEVHEMGIMLLVLMPIPYVDASSATAFRERRRRLLVSAAGILVELFVASLALFLWLSLDPGIPRSVAYNVIVLASVSTLLFNGNPLLRYDGYYILSDLVEIPNLGQRSTQYMGYLAKRYLFDVKEAEPPYCGPGERFWFVLYAVSSFVYRMFLYSAIILFIAGKFFIFGVILAIWALAGMVVVPAGKGAGFLLFSPVLRKNRGRAVTITATILAVVLAAVFLLPFPYRTRAEGVVWVPEESHVRAGSSGFVTQVLVPSDTPVRKGDLLVECRDPLLPANVRLLTARLNELEARYNAALPEDRVASGIIREEIENARASLSRAKERMADLTVRSPGDGLFILPGEKDLPDRFFRQGDLIGYVLDSRKPTVRAVVRQPEVDLVRQRTRAVEVRLTERLERTISAALKREVPGAAERLPSTILGSVGGGKIPIDPRDKGGMKTFEKLFQFDLELAEAVDPVYVGGRVYVRFDHGYEPLAFQWYRKLRQLFLKRFNV